MADHEDSSYNCFLISIESVNRNVLYACYRDYLVFMGLVRDGSRGASLKVIGFCWLQDQCLMIIQTESQLVGDFILKLIKRYHYWLLQKGPAMTEFKLLMLEVQQISWLMDSLRFIHQQAVNRRIVEDAMDYHWHSHHVYNGFWSLSWLDTDFILNKFSTNRLAAINRLRQYMQHPHRLDFEMLLNRLDCITKYVSKNNGGKMFASDQIVAEINSQYHQSMLDRTRLSYVTREDKQYIQVRVLDRPQLQVSGDS